MYHATDDELKGTAYAVFNTDTGELDFIRSTETHSNGDTGTVKSISGGSYSGTIYAGFEVKNYQNNIEDKTQWTPWYSHQSDVKTVKFIDSIKPQATAYWFYKMSNCTSIEIAKLDTSKVTDMTSMFDGDLLLSSVDVSGFDTSLVKYLFRMFHECETLSSLDLSNFDTSNVENMGGMFEYCYSLSSFDVSGFNTHAVKHIGGIFNMCKSATTIDVSNWDVSNVQYMRGVFASCVKLSNVDVSKWNTSNATDMSVMFSNCTSLTNIDVSGFNTSNVTTMESMFYNCSNLKNIDVSNFDTSKVQSISYMFCNCSALPSLDVSKFNTSNMTYMHATFYGCSNLSSLNVSNFNTSNVTDMYSMFENCSNLLALDVKGFDTSKVEKMHSMFCRCSKLSTLDVSGFKTSNVTDMRAMFNGCSNLQNLDISSFNTSHVTTMVGMFANNSYLTSIKTSSKFKVASSHDGMFPSPTKTASELISDGTWGLGSETANKAYSASDLPNAFTADGTWYAQAKKYTVTLDANNGTGTMNAISIVNGSSSTLPASTFKRASYKFTGWNTQADGKGTTYADKATITPTSDLTLYAQWQFVPCVIRIPKAVSYAEMPVGVVSTDDSYDISVNGGNMYDVSITSTTNGLTDGTATLDAIVNSVGNPLSFTGDGTKKDRVQIKGTARYAGKYKGSINYSVKVTAK